MLNFEVWKHLSLFPKMVSIVIVCSTARNGFHHSWSSRLIFSSSTWGVVCPGINMTQTEYRLVSAGDAGVSVGPPNIPSKTFESKLHHDSIMHERREGTPKAHKRARKWNPIWNWLPVFIWTWIRRYHFWRRLPYRSWRFGRWPHFSRPPLCTLFIQSFCRLLVCAYCSQDPWHFDITTTWHLKLDKYHLHP